MCFFPSLWKIVCMWAVSQWHLVSISLVKRAPLHPPPLPSQQFRRSLQYFCFHSVHPDPARTPTISNVSNSNTTSLGHFILMVQPVITSPTHRAQCAAYTGLHHFSRRKVRGSAVGSQTQLLSDKLDTHKYVFLPRVITLFWLFFNLLSFEWKVLFSLIFPQLLLQPYHHLWRLTPTIDKCSLSSSLLNVKKYSKIVDQNKYWGQNFIEAKGKCPFFSL